VQPPYENNIPLPFRAGLLIIGFDRKANLLEIMYNIIDEDTINVFHAMKCRKNFLPLIKIRGEKNGEND
jgi:hypothetical protein